MTSMILTLVRPSLNPEKSASYMFFSISTSACFITLAFIPVVPTERRLPFGLYSMSINAPLDYPDTGAGEPITLLNPDIS